MAGPGVAGAWLYMFTTQVKFQPEYSQQQITKLGIVMVAYFTVCFRDLAKLNLLMVVRF